VITVTELAIKNKRSTTTIRNYIKSGMIPFKVCECASNILVPDIILPELRRGRKQGSKNRKKVPNA